jgi:hypothetical protein
VDSQAYQDRINSQLSGMFSTGSTEGTVTGGAFSFTDEDMVKIRDNWLDLADSYRTSFDNAEMMARIEPPAGDMASKFHANAANSSGQAYMSYLEHNRDYCLQQAQLFHDGLADYRGVEHTNVTQLYKAGGDDTSARK